MRSSACARHFILQSKIQNKIRNSTARWDDPTGRFFRFVIAPLRMQQGSLTCHCEPCAARRGNLAVPGWIMGKLSAKSQLPSRDSHVASLLGMTSRRCVSFEQRPVLIGSACRALSVTFDDSSPRGRAKGASGLAMTNLGALRRRMCAAKIARVHGAQGAPLQTQSVRTILTAACTNCKCLPEIATSAYGLLAMTIRGDIPFSRWPVPVVSAAPGPAVRSPAMITPSGPPA